MTTSRPSFQSAIVVAAIALGCFGFLRAGATNRNFAPPATVVATVDVQKLMEGLAEVKARNEVLRADATKKQAELDEMRAKIKKVKEDLELMNKESIDYRNKFAEGIVLEANLQSKGKIYTQLVDLDSGELIRAVYTKIQATVAKVAAKDGYSLVMLDDRGLGLPKTGSDKDMNGVILNKRILFAEANLDITERLIAEMNNEFNAPATAPRK